MFVRGHIDALAMKLYAFRLQTPALLQPGVATKLDLATRTDHTLPGQAAGKLALEEFRHSAVVKRVSGRGSNLAVSGNTAAWQAAQNAIEGLIALATWPQRRALQAAFHLWRQRLKAHAKTLSGA